MLVTDESVRLFTGRPDDSRTTAAVVLAVGLIEAFLGPLPEQEWTETLKVHRLGDGTRVVFPGHRPITAVDDDGGWSLHTPAMIAVPDGTPGPTVDVTYTAGWTEATLPADIALVVANMAAKFKELQANEGPDIDPQLESVSIDGAGGKIIDPGPWGIERLAPGATAILRRHKVGR